ncbi:MAG: histidine phosphatase family protein [Nitriliruptoraceae bacterium]
MRRLVVVRHGESRWNAEGRIQGQACAGLSPRGHEQAQATAEAFADELLDVRAQLGPEAVRLVSSDLQRAAETAQPLASTVGLTPAYDQRARERSFGSWEGSLRGEVAEREPDRWRRWADGDAQVLTEIGGETADQLAERVAPLLDELLRATPIGGVTVLVSHGGAIWHGLHRVLGLPAGSLGPVANASVSELLGVTVLDGADTPDEADQAQGAGGGLEQVALGRYNEQAHLPVVWRSGGLAPGGGSDTVPMTR